MLVVIAVVAAAWSSGLASAINWDALARHYRTLADWIAEHPVLGGGSYMLGYAAAVALSLPVGLLFSTTGGLLFGPILGALLAVAGATLGATLLFLVARSVLGPALANRGGSRAAALRERLRRDGFNYLLAIRLVPLFPFWLVNLAAALCGIPLLSYISATALGILPVSAVLAWTGAGLTRVLASGERPDLNAIVSWPVLAPLLALAVMSLAPLLWKRRDA